MAKEPVLIDHKDLGLVDREHTILDDEWAYRKDEETKPYYGLTHRPCLASIKSLRLLKVYWPRNVSLMISIMTMIRGRLTHGMWLKENMRP